MKHTKEPWKIWAGANSYCFDGVIRSAASPDAIAFVDADIKLEDEEVIEITPSANADRIVACVNACEGINPESVPEMVKALELMASLMSESQGLAGFHLNDEIATWDELDVQLVEHALSAAKGGRDE